MLKSPSSTPNVCVFLELGILPIMYVLHQRKLGFLHHIMNLEDDDPVKQMFEQQLCLPFERNWANECTQLLSQYGLQELYPDGVKEVSKDTWKSKVTEAVQLQAFEQLKILSLEKKKSKKLTYDRFKFRTYLVKCPTNIACTVFRYRSFSVNCKVNRQSSTSTVEANCRLCHDTDETQEHIINCRAVPGNEQYISTEKLYEKEVEIDESRLLIITKRHDRFFEMVETIQERVVT